MAIDYAADIGWHEGEQQMQSLLHVSQFGDFFPTSNDVWCNVSQLTRHT